MFMYVEAYYNRTRMHSALDYATPDAFNCEQVANTTVYSSGKVQLNAVPQEEGFLSQYQKATPLYNFTSLFSSGIEISISGPSLLTSNSGRGMDAFISGGQLTKKVVPAPQNMLP
ncbi:MAG: hypothetical protein LBH75_02055 [Treponema sp.]|jgi:hypothetical protein|nr:hypothetical protein [Treponema sp.]